MPVETPAPSVNVPPTAVALNVGASFTGTTVTLDAIGKVKVAAFTLGAVFEPLSIS